MGHLVSFASESNKRVHELGVLLNWNANFSSVMKAVMHAEPYEDEVTINCGNARRCAVNEIVAQSTEALELGEKGEHSRFKRFEFRCSGNALPHKRHLGAQKHGNSLCESVARERPPERRDQQL